MRKTISVAAMMLGISLMASYADAYTVEDMTWILEGHSRSDNVTGWVDVSGANVPFQVFGVDIAKTATDMTFDLYTNFSGPQSITTVTPPSATYNFYLADFAIDADRNGSFEYGVVLQNHSEWTPGTAGAGPSAGSLTAGLYKVTSWDTSAHFFEESHLPSTGGIGYGELYGQWVGGVWQQSVPLVAIAAGTPVSGLTILQTSLGGVGTTPLWRYSFTVNLSDLTGLDPNGPAIFWGGDNAASDAIAGSAPVPEPATMLLLGTGLAGLFGVSKRRAVRKASC